MMLKSTLGVALAALACLSMASEPVFARNPADAAVQVIAIPSPDFACASNRFTNGNFAVTSQSADAAYDQDIYVAPGWQPLWQPALDGSLISFADLFSQNTAPTGFSLPAPPMGSPSHGNYAGMWVTNQMSGTPKFREGMLNMLAKPIIAKTGVYGFTFKTAPLDKASTTLPPSVLSIFGVRRAPNAALPLAPTGISIPPNKTLFGVGSTVLLATLIIPATDGNVWKDQFLTFDSAAAGWPSEITHIMITRADAADYPAGMQTYFQSHYVAFDDFCLQPLPSFNACCPPWNAVELAATLDAQATGSSATPFRIRFVPTAPMHNRMNAYIGYLKTLGLNFSQLRVTFQLLDAGAGMTASAGTAMTSTTLHWNGSGTPAANFFANSLPPHHWYSVRTTISAPGGPREFIAENCTLSTIHVRWRPRSGGGALVDIRHEGGLTEVREIAP